jgi:hypothetical protein
MDIHISILGFGSYGNGIGKIEEIEWHGSW